MEKNETKYLHEDIRATSNSELREILKGEVMFGPKRILEKDFQNRVLEVLDKFFNIDTQITGRHYSGRLMKIDAILKPRQPQSWKDPNVALGVEFKSPDKLGSTTDKSHWMTQCVDYANTDWNNYGYIHIFSCPAIFESLQNANVHEGIWLLNRLLSNMGVGELKHHPNYGWCFYLQDSHLIWSEKRGVVSGRVWKLRRTFGCKK